MGEISLKSSLYRIITDLIKADNIIAIDELDFLDKFCKKYRISEKDKLNGYQTTLADAFSLLSTLSSGEKERLLEEMKISTASDGDECSFTESLFIQATLFAFNDKTAFVVSMPAASLPLQSAQIVYLENADRGAANAVLGKDEPFEDIDNIARIGGFELIYIPRIAKHYSDYRNTYDLERVFSLVSPTRSKEQVDATIRALQHMTTRYFYLNVLKDKLQMPLDIHKPVWMVRIINDVVDGNDFANFLCFGVKKDVKKQIRDFVSEVNSRMHEYPVMANDRRDTDKDFLYSGFYKSILDVMSIKKVDRWELRIRTYGDGTEPFKDPETGKKTVMSIFKDGREFPLFVSGRDAAFYTLLICASASAEGAVDFSSWEAGNRIERRYEYLYQRLSRRSIDGATEHQKCPDVTAQETRIPMKCRLINAIKNSKLTEQSMYMPQDKEKGVMYVPVEPDKVTVISTTGAVKLLDSPLYKDYLKI